MRNSVSSLVPVSYLFSTAATIEQTFLRVSLPARRGFFEKLEENIQVNFNSLQNRCVAGLNGFIEQEIAGHYLL